MLVPICVAFILAIGVNQLAAQKIGSSLLENQVMSIYSESATVSAVEQRESATSIDGLELAMPQADPIGKINVTVTAVNLEKLAGTILLLLLISIAYSGASILFFQPRRILIKKE